LPLVLAALRLLKLSKNPVRINTIYETKVSQIWRSRAAKDCIDTHLALRYLHLPWRSNRNRLLNIQTGQKKQRMCTTNQSALDGARDEEREPMGGVAEGLALVGTVNSEIEPEFCRRGSVANRLASENIEL
jgi:hypothetical protein